MTPWRAVDDPGPLTFAHARGKRFGKTVMDAVDESVHFVELSAQRRLNAVIRRLATRRRAGSAALHHFDLPRHYGNLLVELRQE